MITVFGARGTLKDIDLFVSQLAVFSKTENLVVQAFDASAVYGKDHLVSAMRHAQRAFEQKTNATNSLALEILLYAAGERQIQKAIKKIGVKKGKQTIAFILIDLVKRGPEQRKRIVGRLLQQFHLRGDDSVLKGDRTTLKKLGITDHEIATIPEDRYGDLVLEKVALVDVIK